MFGCTGLMREPHTGKRAVGGFLTALLTLELEGYEKQKVALATHSRRRGLLTESGAVHWLVLKCSVRSATCLHELMVRTGGVVVGGR